MSASLWGIESVDSMISEPSAFRSNTEDLPLLSGEGVPTFARASLIVDFPTPSFSAALREDRWATLANCSGVRIVLFKRDSLRDLVIQVYRRAYCPAPTAEKISHNA